jgi:magnesium chelatase family protein
VRGTLLFPAQFALVAAMNPCPCGYFGDPEKDCRCAAYEVMRYQGRISGPLLDRIDLQIHLPRVATAVLREHAPDRGSESRTAKQHVEAARAAQLARFRGHSRGIVSNAEMSARDTEGALPLERDAERFLDTLSEKNLSPRGYYRLLKTARTIADLDGMEKTTSAHLAEAFGYRVRE